MRDVRVFGQNAVVLDDQGFHLIDSDLQYVTLIARRKISVQDLSLAKDRLAISYDIGGLCRIMDVSPGTTAKMIGQFNDASLVTISPDGNWLACRRNDELQVFNIREQFAEPVPAVTRPIDSPHWAIQWLGSDSPRLLVGIQDGVQGEASDRQIQLQWRWLDPQNGAEADPERSLPKRVTSSGNLVQFELAPNTQKYLALTTRENAVDENGRAPQRVGVWAVSDHDPAARVVGEGQGILGDLNPISVSFSEIDRPEKNQIGTRMVVLSEADDPITATVARTSRVFLLSDDLIPVNDRNQDQPPENAGDDPDPQPLFRMFEIESVIEVTDGRYLLNSEFSGDGRSLLEVDDRGLKVLLSKDWN